MFCLFHDWVSRVGWVWIARVLCPTETVHRGNTWQIVCGLMTLALSAKATKMSGLEKSRCWKA